MPLFCIQCALESFVAHDGAFIAGAGVTEETADEHLQRCHAIQPLTAQRRRELDEKAAEIVRRKGLA